MLVCVNVSSSQTLGNCVSVECYNPPIIQCNSFHSSDPMSGAVSNGGVTGSVQEEELKVCVNSVPFCTRDLSIREL